MVANTPEPGDMALHLLFQQLRSLSPDTDVAGRVQILRPDGSYVADVTLSGRDVAVVNDTLASLLAAKPATEESTRPAELPTADDADIDQMLAQLEKVANGEDGGAS
jgi:hypothetical protein